CPSCSRSLPGTEAEKRRYRGTAAAREHEMNIRTVYETRPPSAGPRPTRKLRAWRWRLTVLGVAIVTAVLGACGSPPAPVPQELLDCEAQGYACTYAEVDLAVIERSMSLAAAVAELLDAGGSLEDGLALLEAEP